MYETLSNYLKIPRCALEDGNQLTKSGKTKAETKKQPTNQPRKEKAETKEKQPILIEDCHHLFILKCHFTKS